MTGLTRSDAKERNSLGNCTAPEHPFALHVPPIGIRRESRMYGAWSARLVSPDGLKSAINGRLAILKYPKLSR